MPKPTTGKDGATTSTSPAPIELTDAELDAVAGGQTLGQVVAGFVQNPAVGGRAVAGQLATGILGQNLGTVARTGEPGEVAENVTDVPPFNPPF